MPESVNVKSLDALQEFRSALIHFIDKAKRATSTAESEVYSVQAWVSNTQMMYWRNEMRKSEEKLSQAKSELYRASISQPDNPRGRHCGPAHRIVMKLMFCHRLLRIDVASIKDNGRSQLHF